MKRIKFPMVLLALALGFTASASAQQWVQRGYGGGYYRTAPNGTVTDNYSYKGNYNPYTGSTGSNHYRNSPSSPYYGTGSGYGSSSGYRSSYGSGYRSGYGFSR